MTPLRQAAEAYTHEHSRWRIIDRHPPKPKYSIVRSDYESGSSENIFETDDHGQANVFFDRLRGDASMRAALLALAGCELPESAIAVGIDHATDSGSEFDDIQPTSRAFRAMLRSIASEGKSDE